ncbi:MAG: BlaI/MecI/CopY family transcriptional regulator [Planctomycetia bacterium]
MSRFTAGELRVMQLLWEHGELKPSDLQRLYAEPIKNSALRSYLTILVDKGHVARRKDGKAFFYAAATPRQQAFSTMLGDLVKTFCAGSVPELMMTLVRKEKLSEDDLLELKRLADQTPTDAAPSIAPKTKKKGAKR